MSTTAQTVQAVQAIQDVAWYNQPIPLTRTEIDLIMLRLGCGMTIRDIARIWGLSRQAVYRMMNAIWNKAEQPRIMIDGRPCTINKEDLVALLDALYDEPKHIPGRRALCKSTILPGDYIDYMLHLLTQAGCLLSHGPRCRYELVYNTKERCLERLGIY
jgi:hypothetical protein